VGSCRNVPGNVGTGVGAKIKKVYITAKNIILSLTIELGEKIVTNPETVDAKERAISALVYLLPLIYVIPFGYLLLRQFPILANLFAPLIAIYITLPFAGIIVFFVLWFAIVRNDRFSYFVRFNAMQAILLDIFLILCNLVMNILSMSFGRSSLLTETLNNTIFLGIFGACIYAIVQSVRGFYAEIPAISEAASSQIR
jgi:hypothetical protein